MPPLAYISPNFAYSMGQAARLANHMFPEFSVRLLFTAPNECVVQIDVKDTSRGITSIQHAVLEKVVTQRNGGITILETELVNKCIELREAWEASKHHV